MHSSKYSTVDRLPHLACINEVGHSVSLWMVLLITKILKLCGFLSPHAHRHAGVYHLLFVFLFVRRIFGNRYLRRGLT